MFLTDIFVKSTQYRERTQYSLGTQEHQQNYSAGADNSNHEHLLYAFSTVPTELTDKGPPISFSHRRTYTLGSAESNFPKKHRKDLLIHPRQEK